MKSKCCNVVAGLACVLLGGCSGPGADVGKSIVDVDMIPVEMYGLWGFVNRNGETVIEPEYRKVSPFVDGISAVFLDGDGVETGWGLIDTEGDYVIRPSYNGLTIPSEGVVWAMDGDVPVALDAKGEMLFELPQADAVWAYSDGMARFTCPDNVGNRVYGFVDRNGKVVVEPVFESAEDFSEGFAEVRKNGKEYYINKKGENAFGSQTFAGTRRFVGGRAAVLLDEKEGISGVIDSKGELQFTKRGGVLLYGSDSYVFYTRDGFGLVDAKGEVVVSSLYEDIEPFYDNDLAPIRLGNRYGYVNRTGKIQIDPQWRLAKSFVNNEFAFAATDDMWGMINRDGKYIVEPQWDDVSDEYVNACNGAPFVSNVVSDYYFVNCAAVAIYNFIKDGKIDEWDLTWTAEDIAKHIGMSRYMFGRYGREHLLKRDTIGTKYDPVNVLIYLRGEFFKNQSGKSFAPLDYVEGVKPDNVMIQFWQDDYKRDYSYLLFAKLEQVFGLEHYADGSGQYGIGQLAGYPVLLSEYVSPYVGRKGIQIEFGNGIDFPSEKYVDDSAGDDYVEESTYEGTIGETPIVMEVAFHGDGSMSGRYRYKSNTEWIDLSGSNNDGVIDFTEKVDGKVTGAFSLALNDFNLIGTWTNQNKTEVLKVELHYVE